MTSDRSRERTIRGLQQTLSAHLPDARFRLAQDEDDETVLALYVYSEARPSEIRQLTIAQIARSLLDEHAAVYVVPAVGAAEPDLEEMLKQPLGTPVRLTLEQALAVVEAGIGGRPDLPAGTEYVRQIREEWRGLTGRG